MMRGKRENFFSREKKPNVGFVILVPLSRHSLGDGGSHPFKKSEKTFLFGIVIRLNITHKICFVNIRKTLVSIGGCIRGVPPPFRLSHNI